MKALFVTLSVILSLSFAQDDLADYPIKEEVCEDFASCLTECVKKLPPNRQFTEIVWRNLALISFIPSQL
jgi:hypothetical protein